MNCSLASDFEKNIEKKTLLKPSPSVKRSIITPVHNAHLQKPHLFWKSTLWKVRSIHGKKYVRLLLKLMPWRFQETLGGLKLEVFATEIFREKQFPWGWTEPTAKTTTCRFQQRCNFEKKRFKKQKTLHFQQLVAGTKSYFQPFSPKKKKIPENSMASFSVVSEKCWNPHQCGKQAELKNLVAECEDLEVRSWKKGKRPKQICRWKKAKLQWKIGKKRQLLETHSG